MDGDLYLKFLYNLVETNQIREITKIKNFNYKKELNDKDLIIKKINALRVIVPIKLENGNYILIDDLPMNFFLSHTIVIGEMCKLFSFQIEGKNELYYGNSESIIRLGKLIDKKTVKQIDPKSIVNTKFELHYETSPIIKNIKEYILDVKKIDMNKIQLVKTDKLENFIPTVKSLHFHMAIDMNIPIEPLVKDNFISHTSINIFDKNTQVSKLKPLNKYETDIDWFFDKEDNNETYKDISSQYYIILDYDTFTENLEYTKSNLSLKELHQIIQSVGDIEISSQNANTPIPLFKSHLSQNFLKIKDLKKFEEISGRELILENNYLGSLLINTISGERAIFKEKYLNPEIEKIIENYEYSNRIEFETGVELIVKLLLNSHSNEIIEKKSISENRINNIFSHLNKIEEYLIKETINQNKIPTNENPNEIDDFYKNIKNKLIELFNSLNKDIYTQREIIIEILKITLKINNSIKYLKLDFQNTFYILQNYIIILRILKKINPEKFMEKYEEINSLFKTFKVSYDLEEYDTNQDKLIEDIILANSIDEKEKIAIYIENNDFIRSQLSKKIKILIDEPKNRTYYEPNEEELKKIFPYSVLEICEQIKEIENQNIFENNIEIRGRKVKIKKEYVKIVKVYDKYKIICENNNFKILKLRS